MPNDPLPDWVLTRRRAIGGGVREARTACRISQEKLGEMADLDRKTINRIEQGVYSTLLDHLLLIADALDVQPAELFRR
ncbi:helix-turn-helix transcriptional regulator [Streptomyces spectabilis]|uniref:helix-turn-helix domain-containing protein n=1 Tax=Streptomyces spectabilis TaxID=68270 RepID=UPI0033C9568B